ncbi:MAG: 50S ribosomal protein L4, partial [Bacteroidaceae bacterium]|nr:50S ribosomal protein L4 [Bacteroidaceae bacterium]
VEDFTLEAPKTKLFVEILNNLKISDKKALFVLPGTDKVVYLSSRNIERVKVMAASALNTYRVLDADVMVVSESSLPVIESNLNK